MEIFCLVRLQQKNSRTYQPNRRKTLLMFFLFLVSAKQYEIRPSVGKGLGIFAVQDITHGTRITWEEPMMRIPSTNRMDVPAAFLKFSKVTKPHSGRYTVGHWESETPGQLIYCAYIRCSDSRQQRFFLSKSKLK